MTNNKENLMLVTDHYKQFLISLENCMQEEYCDAYYYINLSVIHVIHLHSGDDIYYIHSHYCQNHKSIKGYGGSEDPSPLMKACTAPLSQQENPPITLVPPL